MQPITYTHARQNLAATMDKVIADHQPVVITRSNAEAVVMMSLADYTSIQETGYLLSNPANTARLRDAVAAHKAGMVEAVTLDDLDTL